MIKSQTKTLASFANKNNYFNGLLSTANRQRNLYGRKYRFTQEDTYPVLQLIKDELRE